MGGMDDEKPRHEDDTNDGQSWLPWHWTTNQWCVAGLCGSLLAAYLWLILLELGSRVDG